MNNRLKYFFYMIKSYFFIFYLQVLRGIQWILWKPSTITYINSSELETVKEYCKKRLNSFINAKRTSDNIDACFYTKTDYNKSVEFADNELEKIWSQRILIEYTPRGNIIMYYDAYRMGFIYFSDTKDISYEILNAVAMKYVVLYGCSDFFTDETVSKENFMDISPLIKIHEQDKNKDKNENKSEKKPNLNTKDAPFATLKTYTKSVVNKKPPVMLHKNKFFYMGKIVNFSPYQNIYKKHGKKVEIFIQPFDISAFLHDTYMMDLQKVGSEQCAYNEQSVHNKPFFFDREPNPCISENATSLFYSPVFDHSDSEKIPQLEQISKTDKKMSYKDYRLMNNK